MLPNDGSKAPPLRVILLLDSLEMPQWVATRVTEMCESDATVIVGIVLNGGGTAGAPTARPPLPARVRNAWRHRHRVLLDLYLRLDRRRYHGDGVDPFAPCDGSRLVEGVPRIVSAPQRTSFSDFLDEGTLEQMRAWAPDVAIRFGFRILRGPVLTLPVHGVWSFHHGDQLVNRGGPPGVWEVLRGWPSTGAVLQRLSEELDGGTVLARTRCATNPISVHQNRVALYRAAGPLLMVKLEELHRHGAAALQHGRREPPFSGYSNRLFVAPTTWELLSGFSGVLTRLARRKVRAIRATEQWQLAYCFDHKQPASNTVPRSALFRFKPLVPPNDRFWADPFVVQDVGRSFVFLEEYVFAEQVGRIAVVEVGADGALGAPRTVVSAPHHLSYPFVFRHDGCWYMYAESSARGVQELYRAESFPFVWVLDRELCLGQPVVDATPYCHDGRWWLFAGTSAGEGNSYDQLSLFSGPSPLGPWVPHRANPVLSDATRARPAGRFFESGGSIIRPSQDGTPTYGSALVFSRIVQLDDDDYVEEVVSRITPDWSPSVVGIHTINAAGHLTVADVRVLRTRPFSRSGSN